MASIVHIGLCGPGTAGHAGCTGTCVVIDFASRSFVMVLSNRVRPNRRWGSNNPGRRLAAQGLAVALGVRPPRGAAAWFSGTKDATSTTLTTRPLDLPRAASLSCDLFVDTESSDPLALEASRDGSRTWAALPFRVRDRGEVTSAGGEVTTSGTRRWQQATAAFEPGSMQVRWRCTTDGSYAGRGVFVDGSGWSPAPAAWPSTASEAPRRSSPRGGARRADAAVG